MILACCAYVVKASVDIETHFDGGQVKSSYNSSRAELKMSPETPSVSRQNGLPRPLESRATFQDSEQRFRLLVEAVQDYAIFMLDPEGHVKNWNSGAKRIKGYESSEIIGKHFSCFYPEEDLRNGKPQWELLIAAKEGRFEDEGWRVRKDGSKFWANVIITAIRDEAGKLIGFGKVTRDITERMQLQRSLQEEVVQRREAEQHLRNSENSLRELSHHLLRTQDEERRRIGRDLHDSLGQCLAALKIRLDGLASSSARDDVGARSEIAECLKLAEESLKELRTISYLMYPPMLDEMGLQSAIRWYLEGFSTRSGLSATFDVDPDFGRLQRDLELALFRVLQESLTNVHRHSGSKTARIRLRLSGEVVILEVNDAGRGISSEILARSGKDGVASLGVGLRGMNERMRQLGGSLQVSSTENGTTVTATVRAASYSSSEDVPQIQDSLAS
jgi:PAS domain S-box-containing protein